MESFSKTLDTYTDSYVARRRRKRLMWAGLVLLLLAAGSLTAFLISRNAADSGKAAGKAVAKQTILANWKARNWDLVLADSTASLQASPLDGFYLGFAGLSSFYKGSELPEGEEKAALMDQAVTLLRKTLVLTEKNRFAELPRAQLEYVLGKSYYYKGEAYWDETAKWLEASIADGYHGQDSLEFLGVAYAGIGRNDKAIESFEKALAQKRTDLLLIAAAKAYQDSGNAGQAESLLLESLSRSGDVLTREKCRFALASIYESRSDLAKAREQLELVIKENQQSADAHYRLGLVLQKQGDALGARSEWRKAVSIDPMHAEARMKLSEKL
jgi:tetratricopeptide (TPR) repeat protein